MKLDRVKIVPHYECTDCKRQLRKGEFIAIMGKTPPTGLSTPTGRADAILKKIGKIYCEKCFGKRYDRR